MIGRLNVGGGLSIDGIIEEYVAGGEISAGGFVKFVNELEEIPGNGVEAGTDIQLYSFIRTMNIDISAIALSDNKVFIAYSDSENNTYGLYGIVCTINDNSITKGTSTKLNTAANGNKISAVALSENKVVIFSHQGNGNYLWGTICTISGMTITVEKATQLSTESAGTNITAVVLSETKVVIITKKLNGIVCTISGTTISKGTDNELGTEFSAGSITKLSDTKIVIIGYGDYGYGLYGVACTINGTKITAGTTIQLDSQGGPGNVVALSDTKVFIAYRHTNNKYYLYAMVCTISGTSITKKINTQLSTEEYSGTNLSILALSSNKVFIVHGYNLDNNFLYGLVCTITDTAIITGIDTQLTTKIQSAGMVSAVLLSNTNAFVAYKTDSKSDNYLHGVLCSFGTMMLKAKALQASTDEIGGIAKTSVTSGQPVQVVVPSIKEEN